jgi:predicted dehydrogenase
MIVYDDLEPSEKVKVYDKGITVGNNAESLYKLFVGYRTGDMWAPQLDLTEALKTEALHFVRCIEDRAPVITDGEAGLRVVRLLEASTQSLLERGRLVEVALPALRGVSSSPMSDSNGHERVPASSSQAAQGGPSR